MSTNTAPTKDIRINGIILRRTNYGEADRILNILTTQGKITAIAKSVRKAKSKLAGGIEMFSLIDFNIHLGRSEMGIVTGAKMLKYYDEIIKDFTKMELAGTILKKTSNAAENSDNPEFFNIVEQCLTGLNSSTNIELVESWFLLNLTKATGEDINLYRDTTGDKLTINSAYSWDVANDSFSKSEHGEYGTDEIKMLRLIMTADLKTVQRVKVPTKMYSKLLNLARMAAHM